MGEVLTPTSAPPQPMPSIMSYTDNLGNTVDVSPPVAGDLIFLVGQPNPEHDGQWIVTVDGTGDPPNDAWLLTRDATALQQEVFHVKLAYDTDVEFNPWGY